jgi:hypothetical protein
MGYSDGATIPPPQQQAELSISYVSRRKTTRCPYNIIQKQQRIARGASTVALLLLLVSIWIRHDQDHRCPQYTFVVAFTIFINHNSVVVTKSSPNILSSIHQQYQRHHFNARRRHAFSNLLSKIGESKSATQLAIHQQDNQNENDDESPLFYNDFDGFKSEDIYTTNEKDKLKATNRPMDVDDTDDDNDDNENDSIINEDALGDWRSFRRKLATQERQQTMSSGLASSSYTVIDNSNKTENGMGSNSNNSMYTSSTIGTADDMMEQQRQNPSQISSAIDNKKGTTTIVKKTKSANELLLEQQNDKLAQEYYQDTWAHEIATVRSGTFCCHQYHSFIPF